VLYFSNSESSHYTYKVVFGNSDEKKDKFAVELDILKNGQADGFILTPPIGSERELILLQRQSIPFVIADRQFRSVDSHCIIINTYQAGYDATMRLVTNNKKRVAILNVKMNCSPCGSG
jgi:LacI family transcriptional regulator